jgi:hypothetical protein
MVGGAFICAVQVRRERIMMLEKLLIAKDPFQDYRCGCRLDAPVELRRQISRRDVDFGIFRIRARGNRGGVRHPHARCRAARPKQPRRHRCSLADNRSIITGKTQFPEGANRRAILRRQYTLPNSQIGEALHFLQSLKSCLPGVGFSQRVLCRGNVTSSQSAVIMR